MREMVAYLLPFKYVLLIAIALYFSFSLPQ